MENKQDVIKKLYSGDITLVQEAIDTIKQEGDLIIVPDLLDLLLQSKDIEVITRITSLLSDIKDSQFKQMLIDKLTQAQNGSEKSNFLRICWESAIDFSEHFSLFVDILIKDEFMAALEASTVIENLSGSIPDEMIQKAIAQLKETRSTDEKAFLIEDTLLHLEKLLLQKEEEEEE